MNIGMVGMGGEEAPVRIYVGTLLKLSFPVEMKLSASIDEFKSIVAEQYGIPATQQRLYFKGAEMNGVRTLHSFDVKENEHVHMEPVTEDLDAGPYEEGTMFTCLDRLRELLGRINNENQNLPVPNPSISAENVRLDLIPQPVREEVLNLLQLAFSYA